MDGGTVDARLSDICFIFTYLATHDPPLGLHLAPPNVTFWRLSPQTTWPISHPTWVLTPVANTLCSRDITIYSTTTLGHPFLFSVFAVGVHCYPIAPGRYFHECSSRRLLPYPALRAGPAAGYHIHELGTFSLLSGEAVDCCFPILSPLMSPMIVTVDCFRCCCCFLCGVVLCTKYRKDSTIQGLVMVVRPWNIIGIADSCLKLMLQPRQSLSA